MTRRLRPRFLAIFLLVTSGCTRPAKTAQGSTREVYVSDSGSVGFEIESLKSENETLRFRATYASPGKLAKFAMKFGPMRTLEDSKDFPMKTGVGRLVAEPGSDADILLSDLKMALEAKAIPVKVQRVKTLPFTFVNLGDNLSQAPSGGGFNQKPPGGWTATKIFLGEGDQESQVFLNFNQTIRKGQFSIKDPDYGDLVLKRLATVL
jgi:hypothetical protein